MLPEEMLGCALDVGRLLMSALSFGICRGPKSPAEKFDVTDRLFVISRNAGRFSDFNATVSMKLLLYFISLCNLEFFVMRNITSKIMYKIA